MKTFSKRISAVLLSVYMVFGVVSTDYLTVQAFEWIVPQLAFDEALPFLLGVLGVFAEVEKSESGYYDYSGLEDDMDAYMIDWGIVADDLTTWKNNIVSGTLNQASNCWTAFKSWVQSLLSNSQPVYFGDLGDVYSSIPNNPYSLGDYSDVVLNSGEFISFYSVGTNGSINTIQTFVYSSALTVEAFPDSYQNRFAVRITGNGTFTKYYTSGNTTLSQDVVLTGGSNVSYYYPSTTLSSLYLYPFSDVADDVVYYPIVEWPLGSADSSVSAYDKDAVSDIGLTSADTRDTAIPGVLPLPWDNVGDTNDEVNDKIAGVIDGVNTGDLSLADAMQKILDWLNALAVDTASDDTLLPENPNKPDETLPDRVQENQDNFGFTLMGFEKLFPFCIPFDIYAFMTLLVAEPVAPVIEYPIYNPSTKQNEIIRIDFSQWESVVHLFRYIFDFLFIIGMLLAARALIGGGDKA